MHKRILKLIEGILPPAVLLIASGCWTPPNANVQPPGAARLIQSGLKVESQKESVVVQAVDIHQRTLTLKLPDNSTPTYKAAQSVGNLGAVQPGDPVTATVTESLAVYLLVDGRLPDGTTAATLGVNARVLLVDPSYRLLTLQYANGYSETLKPGLDAKLLEMAPGDSVVVSPEELIKLRIEAK